MSDINVSVDLSQFGRPPAVNYDPARDPRRKERNGMYFAIIGVSFALSFAFYYVFFKTESQKDRPQIVTRPALSLDQANIK